MPRTILQRYFYAFAALLLCQLPAQALVLDWDIVTWADGSLNNSYPMAGGNDVTVNVTPNNGAPLVLYSGAPNPQTPTINSGFQGGLATAENTLVLAVDLTNPTQSITITISFANPGGVQGVSFKLFDIDAGGGSQDELTMIRALSIDGSTLIAPTITTSANNTLIGSGINQSVVGTASTPNTGPQSGRGNVTIDFGANLIQSLTFTFGCTTFFPDPAYQHFALHDVSFSPVPEVNPAIVSFLSCLAGAGLVIRHRRRARS
ncbi:MAG: hypothetical protein M3128_01130 [Verrucomicrobiota bacterium]|nr:hypothetical protein [Verrucomicrobiota bacterium]